MDMQNYAAFDGICNERTEAAGEAHANTTAPLLRRSRLIIAGYLGLRVFSGSSRKRIKGKESCLLETNKSS